MNTLELVEEFHRRFDHPIAGKQGDFSFPLAKLRVRLLMEEVNELAEALGLNANLEIVSQPDLVKVLDALTDIQYVLDGAYLVFGFHLEKYAAFYEVHQSNMSKLDEYGNPIYRHDGKILKGPNYRPPDLVKFLVDKK